MQQFSIDSRDTKLLNPGIARKEFGRVDPDNPKTLIVDTHEIDYVRQITVYIPAQYKAGPQAPFMVIHDGPKGKPNMEIHGSDNASRFQSRVPALIAIQTREWRRRRSGHERGKEYDTMCRGSTPSTSKLKCCRASRSTAKWKLTSDPDGRAAAGQQLPGGSLAMASRMDWYTPVVLTTSGTFVNQQWPFNPETPGGAWDFHETIIPNSPKKPLRIFLAVGDRDNFNPNVMRDGMHDWVEANHRMAKVLKAKGYPYQYLFCQNSGHGVRNAKAQFLPHAIEWVWKGYAPKH